MCSSKFIIFSAKIGKYFYLSKLNCVLFIVVLFSVMIMQNVNIYAKPMLGGRPWSIETVDWCLSRSGGVPLRSLHGSYCKKLGLLYYGNKNQADLGKAAIIAICRGEFDKARQYIDACQCHQHNNPVVLQNTWKTWNDLVEWANNNVICKLDRQAQGCASNKNYVWKNGRCILKPRPKRNTYFPICTCKYSNGKIGAWFGLRPPDIKINFPMKIASTRCANMALCERIVVPGGEMQSYLIGNITLIPESLNSQTNLVTGELLMVRAWSHAVKLN